MILKNSLAGWKDEFLQQCAPQDPDKFPFVILGNKCDLPAGQRKVKAKEAQKSHAEVPFFETSAKNSTNVNDAFTLIAGTYFFQHKTIFLTFFNDDVNVFSLKIISLSEHMFHQPFFKNKKLRRGDDQSSLR